ncbi:LysR family transcriptional regulator [Diaphorobacter sp. HDW4A]|uniref:LysR family transcriptional regulator n=1 Tax=Diaphorobacter sp. HDW4A TaxID=2714924 RepID=UPI00140A375B|nr:LysR family transcriptional regulator [Diaphorobacter sp. HDW4A]QIL79362.1 LysR family transcriptional regulator [Diaphorobacter sp. HDW4A]
MNRHPQLRFHLPELETFLVVIEEGSFSRAAERLCVSQPAVSSRVKRLEDVLRVQLIKRTTRSVFATEDGELLRTAAQDALAGLYGVLRQFQDRSEAARNRVVIAATPMVAATFLPHIIQSYSDRFPDVQVVLRDMPFDMLMANLSGGMADIGVTAMDGDYENIEFQPLAEEPIVLVVPAKHPLAEQSQVTVEMILPYRMIFLDRYTNLREKLSGEFARFGAMLKTSTATTMPTLMGMLDTGSCVGFLPRSMAQINARESRVIVELADFHATRNYGSVVERRVALTSAVQSFREHLHAEFVPLV